MDQALINERQRVVDFIGTTHNVQAVKDTIREHPDLCQWEQFYLNDDQLHRCIISLLVEAGMTEAQNGVFHSAVSQHDTLALVALLHGNHNNDDMVWRLREPQHAGPHNGPHSSIMIDHYWNYAMFLGSTDVLNCLAQFDDPAPHVAGNGKRLEERGLAFEHGRFCGEPYHGIFYDVPVGELRIRLDQSDRPDMIEQYFLRQKDLFQDFSPSDRYRRPAVVKSMVDLGCIGLSYVPHLCAKLNTPL